MVEVKCIAWKEFMYFVVGSVKFYDIHPFTFYHGNGSTNISFSKNVQ